MAFPFSWGGVEPPVGVGPPGTGCVSRRASGTLAPCLRRDRRCRLPSRTCETASTPVSRRLRKRPLVGGREDYARRLARGDKWGAYSAMRRAHTAVGSAVEFPDIVIPAQAGTHASLSARDACRFGTVALHTVTPPHPECLWKLAWVPASAGMTEWECAPHERHPGAEPAPVQTGAGTQARFSG